MRVSELFGALSRMTDLNAQVIIADNEGVETRAFDVRVINGKVCILAQTIATGDMLDVNDWRAIAELMPDTNKIADTHPLEDEENGCDDGLRFVSIAGTLGVIIPNNEEIDCAHGLESDEDDSFIDRRSNAEEDEEEEDDDDYEEYFLDDEEEEDGYDDEEDDEDDLDGII
jgi:hypothetical protein